MEREINKKITMRLPKFKEFLNENSNSTYSRGCAMIYFDFPIEKIHKQIDERDIYTEEGDKTYGLEDEAHITLLYGFDESVTPKQIKDICDKQKIGDEIILTNASLFENEKYDVLKFDVRYPTRGGSFLHKCNQALKKLPHENSYPNYHPHCTIAYIKPGMGKKYTEILKDKEYKVSPDKIVYSEHSGKKTDIEIKQS